MPTSYQTSTYYYHKNRVEVECSDCGVQWMKSKYTLKGWRGRCKSCAMKIIANDPDLKAAKSERAREQVLRQGGVPNAKHFTSERVSGENNVNWRKGRKGEDHWNWQGGITEQTKLIRCSIEYKEWRKAVFARDNFTCQICGDDRGGNLHADHHPKPFCKIFAEFRDLGIEAKDYPPFWDVNNGRTLCESCHKQHGWELFREENPRKKATNLNTSH